jgi:tRNA-2-methylthio-N6-dimethylallyladenosine synthase
VAAGYCHGVEKAVVRLKILLFILFKVMIKLRMKRKYYMETYGCQMNKAESGALAAELQAAGYGEAVAAEEAEWVIINTCSVRQTAEDRVWGRLGYFKTLKQKYGVKVAIMGCMAERLKEDRVLFKTFEVDAAIGSFDKKAFVKKLAGEAFEEPNEKYSFFRHHASDDGLRAFIPIMHGCNNFCSYCIVPYVRGREVSRPAEEIIDEIKSQYAEGIKEVVLLGQNVNSYRHGGLNFAGLLKKISREAEGDFWLRFTSSHPKDFTADLLEALRSDRRFCRHLHLAAQHGSSKILKEMNRGYTDDYYLNLLTEARAALPELEITTDLMVGFPGESDDDHAAMLSFVRACAFNDAYTYQYNDREGVAAARRTDKIDEKVKTAAAQRTY